MDMESLESLHEKLLNLQHSPDNGTKSENGIPSDQVLNGVYCHFVGENTQVCAEGFTKLKDIIGAKTPLILASKSDKFWPVVEKVVTEDDKSFDFVSHRKRSSKSSKHSSSADQSTMCGSPLKLDIIADLSVFDGEATSAVSAVDKQAVLDFGLKLKNVRRLLSMYSYLFSSFKNETATVEAPTLVAVSDGENVKSISSMSLEPLFDKVNNFTGFRITETLSEPAKPKSFQSKRHPNFVTTEVTCCAKYDIFSETVTGGLTQIDIQGMLSLELEWRKNVGKSLVLLHDPPIDAKAKVNVRVISGDTRSPAFNFFQELEILGSIIQGLSTRQVNWIGTQEHPLVHSVEVLVEQLKTGHEITDNKLGDTSQDDDYSVRFDCELTEDRKDLDFTDHLWKVLQNCTSYNELVEAFNYIISEVRKGELQPNIHIYNASTIGRMVRDSYRGQMRAPSMMGSSPLTYLAEIGDQKVTQDYVHAFLSRNLVVMSNLDYYMEGNLELEEKLLRLQKLQNTLELVILLKQCLHLPHATLSECCRQMLKHYETNSVDPSHFFTFVVPTSCLTNAIESFTPTEWKARGVRLVRKEPEQLVYNFTIEQPFDWVKLKTDEKKSSSDDSSEVSYFLTIAKDSVSFLD